MECGDEEAVFRWSLERGRLARCGWHIPAVWVLGRWRARAPALHTGLVIVSA